MRVHHSTTNISASVIVIAAGATKASSNTMSRKEQSTLEFFLGRDNKKRTVAQTKGQHQCRYCSETFESTQGRGSHENAHIAKGDRIVTKRSIVTVRWEPLRLRALRVRAGIVNRMIGNLSPGGDKP